VHKYWLVLEDVSSGQPEGVGLSTATKLAVFLNRRLNYPVHTFHGKWTQKRPDRDQKTTTVQLMGRGLTCDTHLFNLRTVPSQDDHLKPAGSALIMLHSQHADRCEGNTQPSDELECDFSSGGGDSLSGDSPHQVFNGLDMSRVTRTTLTGSSIKSEDQASNQSGLFKPRPMTIETFKVDFQVKS